MLYNQEQDKAAQAEEAGRVVKGKTKGEAGKRAQRQGPKNPRKINKKDNNAHAVTESSEMSSSSAMETGELVIQSTISPSSRLYFFQSRNWLVSYFLEN